MNASPPYITGTPAPRPWSEALEQAIARMFLNGHSVATIGAATRLREDRIRQILREQFRGRS